jgi:hypothetical protein
MSFEVQQDLASQPCSRDVKTTLNFALQQTLIPPFIRKKRAFVFECTTKLTVHLLICQSIVFSGRSKPCRLASLG